jgi:xenotropic and polytropic retrovirus receptor 1
LHFCHCLTSIGLLDPTAPKFLLRPTLAYRQTWIYYAAMIIDPILRFNWVFYAIYAHDLQHSTIVSFFVGLSEVLRRGIWVIFRVENEHCTNVGRFRASRDIPLPFEVREPLQTPAAAESGQAGPAPEVVSSPAASQMSPHLARIATGSDRSRKSPGLRFRRATESPLIKGLQRVGSVLHLAHAQDFERRKPDASPAMAADSDTSDEEDAADQADVSDAEDVERVNDLLEENESE